MYSTRFEWLMLQITSATMFDSELLVVQTKFLFKQFSNLHSSNDWKWNKWGLVKKLQCNKTSMVYPQSQMSYCWILTGSRSDAILISLLLFLFLVIQKPFWWPCLTWMIYSVLLSLPRNCTSMLLIDRIRIPIPLLFKANFWHTQQYIIFES